MYFFTNNERKNEILLQLLKMLRLILDYVSIYVFKNITQGKIMTIYLIIYDLNPEKFPNIIFKSIRRPKKHNKKIA